MNRVYHKWFSGCLQRDMELLVFGDRGKPVIFFPTRTARFFDYENWGVIGALEKKIDEGKLQIFCVDSIDAESFYNTDIEPARRIIRHLQYEDYIIEELVPFIREHNADDIIVAGCSMGAYHAVNLVLKYPAEFVKVVGMSGRYDLTLTLQFFRDLFDGYEDEKVYLNMPSHYMGNLEDQRMLFQIRSLDIILAIGETDAFLPNNVEFSSILSSKDIYHDLFIWEGEAHKPRHWQKMVQLYF
jgi:esterase/lipase superfamily enzyme